MSVQRTRKLVIELYILVALVNCMVKIRERKTKKNSFSKNACFIFMKITQNIHPDVQQVLPNIHPDVQQVLPNIHPDVQQVLPNIHPDVQQVLPNIHPDVQQVLPKFQFRRVNETKVIFKNVKQLFKKI